MKLPIAFSLLLLTAAGAFAQAVVPVSAIPQPAAIAATAAPGSVTVTIVDQTAAPIGLLTGTTVKSATLLDATICNEGEPDQAVDNSMVYQRINSRTKQALYLYDSQVVARVLAVFQDKNVYARLFRAGAAASTVGIILTSALKLNPAAALTLAIAPQIYQAVLPVIHSPEDLQALVADIVPQNTGAKLAGHSCRSGIVIGRTNAPVATEVIEVQ